MVVLVAEIPAATLALNYDVFSADPFVTHASAKFLRRVRKVTIVGGAGVDDCKMDLFYGSKLIAKSLYNVATGLSGFAKMAIPIVGSDVCKTDEKLSLIVTDAGNTNPYNIKLEIV